MNQGFQQGFVGPQQIVQPGFAGTNAQQVRQQNAQSQQGLAGIQQQPQFAQQQGFGGQQGFATQGFAGPQQVLQPGFAGTNAQQVRQQNAQSQQNLPGFGQQPFQQSFQQQPFQQQPFQQQPFQQQPIGLQSQFAQQPLQQGFVSPQQIVQPGFAGTNAQQVRQQNAQSQQNLPGIAQQPFQQQSFQQPFQQQQQQPFTQQSQLGFRSPQQITQPGFAGTDPQQVRQQNAQSQSYLQQQ